MNKFFDRVRFFTPTTGTGSIDIGAVFNSKAYSPVGAGCQDGDVVTFSIEEGDDSEIVTGVISDSVTKVSRETVELSKIGGNYGTDKMNLSGNAIVRFIVSAGNLNALTTKDDATLTGDTNISNMFRRTGVIAPSEITSDQDDYSPTDFDLASVLLLTADADHAITGLAAGHSSRIIDLWNKSAHTLTLKNQDTGSTATNRFLFGYDIVLAPGESAALFYDNGAERWRLRNQRARVDSLGGETGPIALGTGLGIADGVLSVANYRFIGRQYFKTAGSDTWTKPTGCRAAFIRTVGAGGAGGGVDGGGNRGAGGGGGGGYSERFVESGLGATEDVTVGAGGTAGSSSGGDGTDGGASSFGDWCSASGGKGGKGATSTGGYNGGDGGLGSSGTGMNNAGAAGGSGAATGGSNFGGNGGSSLMGGGARGRAGETGVGIAGGNYGGGGSGAVSGSGGRAGGAGAPGVVIVDSYA